MINVLATQQNSISMVTGERVAGERCRDLHYHRTWLKLLWRVNKWNEPTVIPADPCRFDRVKYKLRFWSAFRAVQSSALKLTVLFSIIPLLWICAYDDVSNEIPLGFRIGFALFWPVLIYGAWSHEMARKVASYPDGMVPTTLTGLWHFLTRGSRWSASGALVLAAAYAFTVFNRETLAIEGLLSLGSAFNLNVVVGGTLLLMLYEAIPRND